MAIVTSMNGNFSGSVGQMTFYKVGDVQIMKAKNGRRSHPVRTFNQQCQRSKMPALVKAFKALKPLLEDAFQQERSTQSMYNLFIKHNLPIADVYLSKEQKEFNFQVLTNYYISQGPLQSINLQRAGDYYISDINLGKLVIDENTTCFDFANAVYTNNEQFETADTLRFIKCRQTFTSLQFNSESEVIKIPVIQCEAEDIKLNLYSVFSPNAKLLNATLMQDFVSLAVEKDGEVSNYLAIKAEENTMIALVQRRDLEKKQVICSTQRLVGENPIVAQLSSIQSLMSAVKSIGWKDKGNGPKQGTIAKAEAVELAEQLDQQEEPQQTADNKGDKPEAKELRKYYLNKTTYVTTYLDENQIDKILYHTRQSPPAEAGFERG